MNASFPPHSCCSSCRSGSVPPAPVMFLATSPDDHGVATARVLHARSCSRQPHTRPRRRACPSLVSLRSSARLPAAVAMVPSSPSSLAVWISLPSHRTSNSDACSFGSSPLPRLWHGPKLLPPAVSVSSSARCRESHSDSQEAQESTAAASTATPRTAKASAEADKARRKARASPSSRRTCGLGSPAVSAPASSPLCRPRPRSATSYLSCSPTPSTTPHPVPGLGRCGRPPRRITTSLLLRRGRRRQAAAHAERWRTAMDKD
ncbi:hypothetical protein ACQJBY_014975 [Aegilops geniculata]